MNYLRVSLLTALFSLSMNPIHAESSWPKTYSFFGRWDLRTAGRAITVSSGSYVLSRFSGSGIRAGFDTALNQPSPIITGKGPGALPTIAWRIDDGDWHEAEIAPSVGLANELPKGMHTIMLMVRGLDEHQSRWNPPLTASLTFTGFTVDEPGKLESPLPKWSKPALTMEFLGDSITEGVLVAEGRAGVVPATLATWTWLSDARQSYAAQTAMALGAMWRQAGFGATGLAHGGSGGAPGALDSFNYFYAGSPRDNWQPDVVVVNQGTNDSGMPAQEYQALYSRYITMIRAAYPKAKIAAVRPFIGAQERSIKAVVDERRSAGDKRIFYINTTGWYTGPVHPNIAGSALLAGKLVEALKTQVLSEKR